MWINPSGKNNADITGVNFQELKARAIPLFLIKRMNEQGPLKVSLAPISLGDIPQTIIEELKLHGDISEKGVFKSVFKIKENESRARFFRNYSYSISSKDYMTDMVEYQVVGNSWDDSAWNETGRVYKRLK